MPLIQLIVILIVVGILLWAVNTFIPMDARVKQILNVVVIIALVIWLLFFLLGVAGINTNMRVGALSPPHEPIPCVESPRVGSAEWLIRMIPFII